MKEKGLLLVISGFSGAGKGTVVKRLLELHNDYALSISATTRSPREGEQNGREYFFKSTEEFESMIDNSELIEYAKYVSNYYGTPKAYVEEQLEAGKNVILEIEIQGALNIKKMYPDAVLLFIMPPSAEELERRLVGRGTEDEATIKARLQRASDEAKGVENYNYIVINDKVDDCVEAIHSIVNSEKRKAVNNMSLINNIKEELKAYEKRRIIMLHPSYSELMAVVNREVEDGEQPIVQSRYSIVKATAARAKEIIDARTIEEKVRKARIEAENAPKEKEKDNKDKKNEPKPLTTPDEARKLQIGTPLIDNAENMKPLSIAVEELYEGKVKIVSNGDDSEIM